MPLFEIQKNTKSLDRKILQKSKTRSIPITTTNKSSGNVVNKIKIIVAKVETALGKYVDETIIIQDEQSLSDYIDACLTEGICAIDTETTGLDPLTDELVGVSIYTPGQKTAYIPINHVSYITGQKVKNQLSLEIVGKYLAKLQDCLDRPFVDIDMFNAPFDIRHINHHTGTRLKCTWDAYLASRCLNENEPNKGLKKLHQKYILKGQEDAFKFDELFKGIDFRFIPIKTAGLYAAHDSKITWEYADYQRDIFRTRENLKDVYWVFKNIEMPVVDVVVDMEDTGVEFDMEYNAELKEKYHKILDDKLADFQKAYHMYDEEIERYQGKVRFDDPINIASVPQLQTLLYDIIGLKGPRDKKTGEPSRSTSEESLKANKDNAVVNAILEYRKFATIVSTFIDKLPECVNPKDGRIHCKFNQYGADTGRFSSSDPNLQNIPSKNHDIRKMFVATDGYVMMSADFSQQEVKGMAQMCGDEGMIEAFKQGKDFYAQIASVAFNYPYEDCLEFRPDGTTNPEGKERRSQAKSILLGINYGRGAVSIAEQLGCTKQKAEQIKEDVFTGFPAIEKFEQDSFRMAEELGYVTTLWGRKRRLPDMTLPDYEFRWDEQKLPFNDDPLDFEDDMPEEVPDELVEKYMKKLRDCWGSQKRKIFEEANREGIWIIDNTKKKADAGRQCVNARIQGSAADQSKLAMIALHNDARLKELGFRILIPVHDEVIAECPKENAKEVAERFAYIMSHSSGDKFTIPISCDVAVSERWYGEEIRL